MITLKNLTKAYQTSAGLHVVLNNLNAVFPSKVSFGIVGRNGAGKSTMLRILGGAEQPDSGSVTRVGRVSWPIG
ncbi:MAG TPA: ATP-binding cassette domain-containing protein, partial [Polyangiaceae bacterium]|nr:ATP-binding cassette domain-containing protein [Polyangiaceae bacterium]